MFGLVCCEFGWGSLCLAWCVVSWGEGFLCYRRLFSPFVPAGKTFVPLAIHGEGVRG